MSEKPLLFGPGGGLARTPNESVTVLGGQRIAYPTTPGIYRTFQGPDGVTAQLIDHELVIFGLVREVVELRKKLGLPT